MIKSILIDTVKRRLSEYMEFPLQCWGTRTRFVDAKINSDSVISIIDGLPLPEHQELYFQVENILSDFFPIFGDEFIYKGVNLPRVVERQLHIYLTEFFNRMAQLKKFIKNNPTVSVLTDSDLAHLLRGYGIPADISLYYSCCCALAKKVLLVKERISKMTLREDLGTDIYILGQSDSPTLLYMGADSRRNRTCVNLPNYLSKKFRIIYSEHESYNKPDFDDCLNEKVKVDAHKCVRLAEYEFKRMKAYCDRKKKTTSMLHRFLLDAVMRSAYFLLPSVIYLIDFIEEINNRTNIHAVLTGLTYSWLYNCNVQWARAHKVPSIFLQDAFYWEDIIIHVDADYAISGSTALNNLLKNWGYPAKNIFFTSQMNDFMNLSIISPKLISEEDGKAYLYDRLNIDPEKRIVLIASDPGVYLNTPTHRFTDERTVLEEFAGIDDVYVIIKPHPSDNGTISIKALKESGISNAVVIKDIDFYQSLAGCDVFISSYSMTALEAVLAGKFVLLMNYQGTNFHANAVKYGIAHYLNSKGDIIKCLRNRDILMTDFSKKRKEYIASHYLDVTGKEKQLDGIITDILGQV